MRVTKMHGLGNDYVFVNGFEEEVADPAPLAREAADRHFGVGGDGLILLLPPRDPAAHVRMRMFNADGSEGEMCGNGVRCLCKLAHDRGVSQENPMRVETGAGVLGLRYELGPGGRVARVTVDMGAPVWAAGEVPLSIEGSAAEHPVVDLDTSGHMPWNTGPRPAWAEEAGLEDKMTCVSVGNPHAVFFCREPDRIPLSEVGPAVEAHAWFPNRANVHFVAVEGPAQARVRTWERGSGATLACGTGASAVCAAAARTGRVGRMLRAALPGGPLTLEWAEDSHVHMTGPAEAVFVADWAPEGAPVATASAF
jgi:diaminopimelate epimerase